MLGNHYRQRAQTRSGQTRTTEGFAHIRSNSMYPIGAARSYCMCQRITMRIKSNAELRRPVCPTIAALSMYLLSGSTPKPEGEATRKYPLPTAPWSSPTPQRASP